MLKSKITHFIEILQHLIAHISQQKAPHETVLREKGIHHNQSNSDENYIGSDENYIGTDGAESNSGWKQLTDRER